MTRTLGSVRGAAGNGGPYRDFSAFGCACADYEYRSDKTVRAMIASPDADWTNFAALINTAWQQLEHRILAEFAKSGVAHNQVELRHHARVQYVGQLNDVEIRLPFERIEGPAHVRAILESFEDAYSTMFSRSARSPELGYLVTTAVVTGAVDIEKPRLPEEPVVDADPSSAQTTTRPVYHRGSWTEARIYDMEQLRPGQRIEGFSVVESSATTLVVPTGREVVLDKHRIFHLSSSVA
ncbi:MAG: hypothetical protein ACLP22_22855 [Solirubrobacteraceae bacterium]